MTVRTRRYRPPRQRKQYRKRRVKAPQPRSPQPRGWFQTVKKYGKMAARHSGTVLKGARFLAQMTGNKRIQRIVNNPMLDRGTAMLRRLANSGRGGMSKKQLTKKTRAVVKALIRKYGKNTARLIITNYLRKGGRGLVGSILGSALSTFLPI